VVALLNLWSHAPTLWAPVSVVLAPLATLVMASTAMMSTNVPLLTVLATLALPA